MANGFGRPKISPHGSGAEASSFVRRIADLINASTKSQRQIAFDIGYDKPNIITMFKQGTTRVPSDKIVSLAFSLEADVAELLLLWMTEYEPALLAATEKHLCLLRSGEERAWIKGLREQFPEGLPPWENAAPPALPAVRAACLISGTAKETLL